MNDLVAELDQIVADGPQAAAEWKAVSTLAFDATSVPEAELIPMTLRLVVMLGLFKETPMPFTTTVWAKFMTAVKSKMNPNPYHNFQHICDVTQTTAACLMDPKLQADLNETDMFTMIIAALCHDLDHPGLNNSYQINAATNLAETYNDISVLEMHHCSASSKLIKETGILDGFAPDVKKKMRTQLIDIVLATDMSKHFGLSGDLAKLLESEERLEKLSASDEMIVMKCVLHMSDISNPAKAWLVSKEWSDRLSVEFSTQGDIEKKEKLPVSPMCDRDTTLQDESSIGFCDFIVSSYLFNVSALAPTVLVPACKTLATNRDVWHSMVQERLQNDEEKMKPWNSKKDAFAGKLATFLEKYPGF